MNKSVESCVMLSDESPEDPHIVLYYTDLGVVTTLAPWPFGAGNMDTPEQADWLKAQWPKIAVVRVHDGFSIVIDQGEGWKSTSPEDFPEEERDRVADLVSGLLSMGRQRWRALDVYLTKLDVRSTAWPSPVADS